MNQPRGTQRYQPTQREDEDALTRAVIELASQYGRYGYRRITALLQRGGWQVGKDRAPHFLPHSIAEMWLSHADGIGQFRLVRVEPLEYADCAVHSFHR